MRKKVIPLALMLIFLLILAWPGKAQRGRFWGLWADQSLNLTEDQLAKIQDLRLEFQKAILPLRMEVQKHYLELRRMIRSSVSQAEIQAKMNQIDKLESELREKFITHQKQIRDLLTPEQKVLFDRWGGVGLGWGRMGGLGLGLGLGRAARGYGRGLSGYTPRLGRGLPWGTRGGQRGAWLRGSRMGRGFWCPYFPQGRGNWWRSWRW